MPEGFLAIKYVITLILMHNLIKGHDFAYRQNNTQISLQTSQQNGRSSYSHLYSPWSQWSSCSASCGQGVIKRTRTCNKKQLTASIEPICHGDSSEYKICKNQKCPLDTPDFRASQCTQYNDKLVAGQRAKIWVPTNGGPNPCELRCKAVSENLIYVFGKAADGTSCPDGVCLDGRCLKIGCDDRIGSGAGEIDMCGICSGRNATCVHYKDVFYEQPPSSVNGKKSGTYQTVLILPVGARNFKLWKNLDDNILGVRDRTASHLFLRHQMPVSEEKRLAGTYIRYSIENNKTFLSINGPTLAELHVMVLLRNKNKGIHYQYWLPLDQPHWETHTKPEKPTNFDFLTSSQADQSRPIGTEHSVPSWISSQPSLTLLPVQKSFPSVTKPAPKIIYPMQTPSPHLNSSLNTLQYGPKRHSFNFWDNTSLTLNVKASNKLNPFLLTNKTSLYGNGFPGYRLHYRTPKPIFNYYEKYRNLSFQSNEDVFQRKSVFLQHHTQRDSGDHTNRKNIALPKDSDKKVNQKINKKGKFNKDLTSRWEYHVNGEDSSTENFLHTPISITVLSLPDSINSSKVNETGFMKNRFTRGGLCGPCHKVRDLTRNFCTSDFVVRATILKYEFLHGETRYELDIQQSFKNVLALLPREYVWSPDTCNCPKIRIGKDYILMGKIDNNYRKNESRLLIDKSCFVRVHNSKRDRRLHKLKKSYLRKCSRISRLS